MEEQKSEDNQVDQSVKPEENQQNDVINMAENDDVVEEKSMPQPVTGNLKKNRLNKKTLIIILSAVVVIIAGGLAFYFMNKDKKSNNSTASPTQSTQTKTAEPAKTEPALDPALKKLAEPSTGETWLSSRKPVADLGYIKILPDEGVEIKYYEVGKRAGNTIYLSSEYMLGELIYLFEKSPAGEVKMISQPSSTAIYNDEEQKTAKDSLSAKVSFDTSIHYDSLSIPSKITLKNGYDVSLDKYSLLGSSIDEESDKKSEGKYSELAKYGSSSLQKFEFSSKETNLTSISYYVTLPIGTRVALNYEPLTTDMSKIKFTTGYSTADDKMSAITRGCGRLLSSVSRADQAKDSDFKLAGQSDAGQNVYEAIDSNYVLVTKAYQEFKDFYSTDTDSYKKSMTKDEFIKNHSVIFFKDKDNQWLVYTRDAYRPAAGCAKPVVYLYPTTAQNVSVKVGANVKVSDPLYDPITGWKNVWADPSGLLSFGGKQYSSLFWEGPGYGVYPNISEGTVVKTPDVINTIKSQLVAQGFNNNEINDFINYWAPNMPNKPYVRLTWFNTDQMNQLAPLNIMPKPDTVIRTFLDFQGLDKPVNIPAQTFEKTPRAGFTVTEWGGLSAKKLY